MPLHLVKQDRKQLQEDERRRGRQTGMFILVGWLLIVGFVLWRIFK